jgi:hypothetical protein
VTETRKSGEGLAGKHVEVFLKTPLFRFRYMVGKEERELLDNAVRISGTVKEDRGAGLLLQVEVLSNMKETVKELPFERIFLPYAKIDFVIVE